MAFTTLEANIFKISGTATGPGGVIAAGTGLQSVNLTTIDQDSGPIGPLGLNFDPFSISTGEAVSFLINGVNIASSAPSFYATSLQTNAGTIVGLAFTIGGDTFFIPQAGANLSGVTQTTAPSVLNTVPLSTVQTSQYGLLPENADTFTGKVFSVQDGQSSLISTSVYDADGIRGNADSAGEEIALAANGARILIAQASEVLATIQFSDGSVIGAVKALFNSNYSGYSTTNSYVFDEAALAAAGKTIADVSQVLGTTAFDHNLNWEALGFDLTALGDSGPFTPDPSPAPPLNQIFGTSRGDTINGTAGRDAIHGLGGSDQLNGGAGADVFFFGAETRDFRRDTDTIRGYEAGVDRIAFEDAAVIRSVTNISGGVRITFEGDRDVVNVFGNGLNTTNVNIFADELIV
jgi:RTX calcium-binding nonapeptide repeat (4 copies)